MSISNHWVKAVGMGLALLICDHVQAKDTLTIGTTIQFEGLNPLTQSSSTPLYIMLMVSRPLISVQNDLKWHPEIIKEVPTFENKLIQKKGEGSQVSIEILPNVQWGDGVPLTCKDLAFTVRVGMSLNVSVPDRSKYENVSAVTFDKNNPKKCTITFKKARYDNVYNMPDILPEHLEGPVFEKHGSRPKGYDQNSLYSTNPTNPGLYFGPYLLSEVKLGSHAILKVNPKFYGSAPKIKTIVVKEISDKSALESHLVSKSVDMLASWSGFSLDQAVSLEKRIEKENLPFKVHFADGIVYMHIDLNLDHPILKEKNVRKALLFGLNRKLLIQTLMFGHARLAHHLAFEKDPWFTDDVLKYDHNVKKANQLLDESGWVMGADGIRIKDGKKLSLVFSAIGGSAGNDTLATFMKEQWKNIGVDLVIKNETARVLYGETLPKRKFDLAFYSWLQAPEANPRTQLMSTSIPSEMNSYAGQNYTGFKNAKMDALIVKLETELNMKKRIEIGRKIIQIYAEELPVLPMYFRATTTTVPKELNNFQATGSLYPESLYVEQWSF